MPTTTYPSLPLAESGPTQVGNYFVANYPPFSAWSADQVGAVDETLATPGSPAVPMGLYVHIPFCRKRCHFCYFRVYTDKNSTDIRQYLDGVLRELALYRDAPRLASRKLDFVYFGGGTPSYLSVEQLTGLFDGLRAALPWDAAREVTFECEPGTLNEKKLDALRRLGVTRLSLGIENFDAHVLEVNGRAHGVREIDRAFAYARRIGFDQINIDLIAGMLDETDANWRQCIARTLELAPDSVTIYQMEIPYNTTIYRTMKAQGLVTAPVADWATKRDWQAWAFAELERAGYHIGSAYTAVRDPARTRFVYRDQLWHGADLLGLGVASFSHVGGVHFQNEHDWGPYLERLAAGQRPVRRALRLTDHQALIREFILQLKLGRVDARYFAGKFGVDVRTAFAEPLADLQRSGALAVADDELRLDRSALLTVDSLLPAFFEPQFRAARYA